MQMGNLKFIDKMLSFTHLNNIIGIRFINVDFSCELDLKCIFYNLKLNRPSDLLF